LSPRGGDLIRNTRDTGNFINVVHEIKRLSTGELIVCCTRYADTNKGDVKYLGGHRARPFKWRGTSIRETKWGPYKDLHWEVVQEVQYTPIDNQELIKHLLYLGFDQYQPPTNPVGEIEEDPSSY
jgi:hypothetical protein